MSRRRKNPKAKPSGQRGNHRPVEAQPVRDDTRSTAVDGVGDHDLSDGGSQRRSDPGVGAQIRYLRDAYAHTIAELDDHYRQQLEAELPSIDYDVVDFGPDEVVDPAVAWPYLVELQQHLVTQARATAAHRGSAEWLWWLRRTRGQFHVNELESTEGYTQSVAEVLAAGNSRPSEPTSTEGLPDPSQGERFTFAARTEEVAIGSLDLLWLRHAALQLYHLHATMMRCAKGQGVIFGEDGVPTAEMDQTLEYAIHIYDQRNEAGSRNALVAVGLHHADPFEPVTDSGLFGGKVPLWSHRQTPAGDPLDVMSGDVVPGRVVLGDPALR